MYFCISNKITKNFIINISDMLTLKLISEETERVIRGLNKKHFKGAEEAINEVLSIDKLRRETQQ